MKKERGKKDKHISKQENKKTDNERGIGDAEGHHYDLLRKLNLTRKIFFFDFFSTGLDKVMNDTSKYASLVR